jgi:hypothetical protein
MIDTASIQPAIEEIFRVACHKKLPCFMKCCTVLKLVLTP